MTVLTTFWRGWAQMELLAELHFKLAREHPTAKMEKMYGVLRNEACNNAVERVVGLTDVFVGFGDALVFFTGCKTGKKHWRGNCRIIGAKSLR